MKTLPPLLLLSASVMLGLWLGWRWLRRQRNPPVHTAVHLVLGGAGLELLVMLRRGAPDGTLAGAEAFGSAAAFLLVTAFMAGLASPIVGRHWGRRPGTAVLGLHAALGAAGFVAFVAWLAQAGWAMG